MFRGCHDHIYANDGLHKDKAFFEFLKIIFCKIEDERNVPNPLEFFSTSMERKNPDGQLTVKNRIAKIFNRVKKRYDKIFKPNDSIELNPRSLAYVVSELQKYSLLNTNIDIKGKAYEEIVGANLRGDRGEFFTPRNVMNMVVEMINPQINETVLDSSCGTGGFLVIAMTHVMNRLEKDFEREFELPREKWTQEISLQFQQNISQIASSNYFGFDLNPDLVKATKMNMVMNNDGSGNIFQANSLLPPHEWSSDLKNALSEALQISPKDLRTHNSIGLFDVIVTNPPFGSKIPIDDEHILKQFDLAHKWNFDENLNDWVMTDELRSSVSPEILFVERCTQFLKPGGRMGIVLPDSILGSPGLGYIRTWIIRHHKILASIDLHADTFQPHNGTQTSVLILQKKSQAEIDAELISKKIYDYDIFMAIVDKVGHDKRGNLTFKRDKDGNEILIDGEKVPDDETADVAKIFNEWKKKLHIDSQIKFCTVKLSEIISHGNRLEAAVFDVDAMHSRQLIINGKFPAVEFKNLATNYLCGRSKVIMTDKSEFPFFQAAQIIDLNPKPSGYVSKKNSKKLIDYLTVSEGQVLMTRSGTIGKVAYVSKTLANTVFTPDLLRIDAKNNFDAGYIYAYFKSKVGQKILLSSIYGAVIQHLEPEHLEKIPIPDAPENLKRQIHELIVKSYDLRDQILIDELKLPPIEDFDAKKNFSVKLSNLRGRLDASFHVPIVDKIISHLQSHADELTTIGDNRISENVILPGRFKRVYVDEGHGITFFGGRSIGELNPSDKKYLSFAMHDEKIRDELTIREKMILITCSGTIGKVAFVPKHWDGWAMTHDIIRLIPRSEIEGYVYIWLQSDYANKIINSFTYGAVVPHIEKFHLESVAIPILKNVAAQKKINALALSANEKRFEAYELEQRALKIMDEII